MAAISERLPSDRPDPSRQVAAWGLASTILTAGLSYLLPIVIGRLMTPAAISETQSLLGLFMMLAMPAGPVLLVVTRRVVDDRGRGDGGAVMALLNGLLARTVAVGAGLLAILVLAREPIAGLLGIRAAAALPLFGVSVISNLLYLLTVAVLLGQLRWRMATALPVALGLMRLALSVALVAAGYDVAGVFGAIAVSTFACFLVAYARARRDMPAAGAYRALRGADLGLALAINAAFWFLVHVDAVYVNSQLKALADRGYGAVVTLARPIVYFPAAVNNLLFPFLAGSTTPATRRRLILRMVAATVALDLAILAVVVAAPGHVLRITFGPGYGTLADTLPIVAASLTSLAALNIVLYDALARHDRPLAALFVAAALVAGALLVATTPTLNGMLAVLASCAVGVLGVGAVRMWRENTAGTTP